MPLYYPLRRLSKTEREHYDRDASDAQNKKMDAESLITDRTRLEKSSSFVLRYHNAYLKGSTTPLKVVEELLAAISTLQPAYRPFTTNPHAAAMRDAAAASSRRFAAGNPLSVWDGVPLAFKDMIPILNYTNTDGSAYHAHDPPATADDPLVARFRRIGAIILPPTSMTEGGVTPLGYSLYPQGFRPYLLAHLASSFDSFTPDPLDSSTRPQSSGVLAASSPSLGNRTLDWSVGKP
jgi:hypothetical protein